MNERESPNAAREIGFTPFQRRVVASGVAVLSFSVVLAFVGAIAWALYRLLAFTAPAITPVVMGVFLSMFFKPYYDWLVRRTGERRVPSVILLLASILVPLGLLGWFGGTLVVSQAIHFAQSLPTILARASAWANAQFPEAQTFLGGLGVSEDLLLFFSDPSKFYSTMLAQISAAYGAGAVKMGVGALKYLSSAGTFLLTLVFFVYFVMQKTVSADDCVAQLPFLKPETRDFVRDRIAELLNILVGFFQRQVVICLVEGVLYGLGFMFTGLDYGFLIGFALGVLNLVPLFGTVTCLPFALLLAYFGDGGSALRLVGVTAVWATGQVLDGYCITPKIQGDKTGLGFAGVIFSFVFWGGLFHSFLGLLLAVPLSAFCLVLWRAVKEKYIKGVI